MPGIHITTRLIAPAQGAAAGSATGAGDASAPRAESGAAIAFLSLFADARGAGIPEAAAHETAPKETPSEQKEKTPEDSDAADAVQLLGLPVALPAPAIPPEPPAPKQPQPDPLAAISTGAAKGDPKSDGRKVDAGLFGAERHAAAQAAASDRFAPPVEALAPIEPQKAPAPRAEGDAVGLLALVQEARAGNGAAGGRPALPVAAPVGTAQWREEFSAAVRVIATERIQSAELHLNPPELGPVQVSLRIESNDASIAFSAPHAETRQALEAALPRLREMLEAGGIALGNASVDVAGSGAFRREQDAPASAFHVPVPAPLADAVAGAVPAEAPRSPRLVDVFA